MTITPIHPVSVFHEEEFSDKMSAVIRQLENVRHEGTFSGFDGKTLYYEYFLGENSRGSVVIVHGLSEFTRKYYEFSWYLLNQGYDVFLYDQRCHGRSDRLTPDKNLIHVDAFSDYTKDLHCFLTNVVLPATTKPLYLYAHSMGGAVAADYLAQHPQIFCKAILSAPMIEPLTGSVSPFIARLGLKARLLFGNGTARFWRNKDFDPNYPFERSNDRSYARFRCNQDIRLADENYRTTPLSVRWVHQSVSLRRRLTSKKFLKKITTPILMVCADEDRMVSIPAQIDFAKNCPSCQRVVLPNATHAILGGTEDTIAAHLQQVMDYFC